MYHIKHRPLLFSDVIGQDVAKRLLSRVILTGLADNAFLFPGPHGTGKTTLARIFARALLCQNVHPDGNPCNECKSCKAHLADTHSGYIEVDAANNSGVDSMSALLERLTYESEGGRIVLLLDESHAISKAGKDALLKILETRSGGSFVVLFCTTELHKMPPALISRSVPVPIRVLTVAEVSHKLRAIQDAEGFTVEDQAIQDLAQASGGHMRDAEQLLRTAYLSRESEEQIVTASDVQRSGVVSLHDLSRALQLMPRDTTSSLDMFGRAMATAGPRAVYEGLLELLVQASKFGLSLERDQDVPPPARDLYRYFPRKIQGLLDYILTRQRIDDALLLRADLIVMHARFLLGDIPDTNNQPQPVAAPYGSTGAASVGSAAVTVPTSTKRDRATNPVEAAAQQRTLKEQERLTKLGMKDQGHHLEPAHPSFGPERTNSRPRMLER
jgi:DNA polymerase III subunit gamma/tau